MPTRMNLALMLCLLLLTAVTASATTTSTGRIGGNFAVSPMGSAQYSIPLWSPPGVHGIQPKLSLTYDSHLGYGLMGPGWTLGGLSAIARCNPTYAQDGTPAPITLTTADGLCLDGNRLRTTGTGVYQTEIANFSQVTASGTAGNGPSSFTVQGKDGLTYEYGNTTDSRILPPSGTTPYVWALDKVTDRSGNHMTFTYYQSGGAYVPLSIQYTAPSGSTTFPYQINFGYTTKSASDTLTTYVAGTQVQQTEQLQSITMTSSGTSVRDYLLSYQTSTATLRATLYAIQECGGSAGTDCLLPTTVGYQYGTAGIANPTSTSGSGATNGTVFSVDIDGDGHQDLVFAVTSGSNYQWWVQLATSTGYGSPINTGAVTVGKTDFLLDDFDATGGTQILANSGGTWYSYKLQGTSFTATSTGIAVTAGAQYVSADVDGDGRPDLVGIVVSGFNFNENIQLNTTSAGTISFVSTPVVNTVVVGYAMSGLQAFGNNQLANSSVRHFDFDGDGRQDLLLYFRTVVNKMMVYNVAPLGSRGTGPPAFLGGLGSLSGPPSSFEAVNWNDDQCTDLIEGAVVLILNCNGGVGTSFTLPYAPALALDWDGDGRTDVLANVNNTWQVYRSEGNTYAAAVSTGISVVGTGAYLVTDKDGDGLSDLAYANSTASNAIYYGLHNGAYTRPDLATSFVDGFGNAVYPAYAAITQPSAAYTATNDESYPYQNYMGPLYVTWHAVFTDPSTAAGEFAWDLDYEGAALNLQGRGFAGFGVIQKFDSRSGLYETSGYSRAFPTTGMRTYDILFTDVTGVQTVADTSATLTSTTLDNTANNQRYFPYASNISKSEYEVAVRKMAR